MTLLEFEGAARAQQRLDHPDKTAIDPPAPAGEGR